MANIVVYDPTDPTVPNRVTIWEASANTPDYDSFLPNVIVGAVPPETPSADYLENPNWKVTTAPTIVLMTAQEEHDVIRADNPALAEDERVKVTVNDTTENYLFSKLQAGTNITLNEINDGGDETLEIVASGGGSGDVTAGANITDNSVVRGDGGVKGIQDSLWTIEDTGVLTASFPRPNGEYMMCLQNTTSSGEFIQMMDFNNLPSLQLRQSTDGTGIIEALKPSGNIYLQAEDGVVKIGDTTNIRDLNYDLLIDHGVLGISNTNDNKIGIQAPASVFTNYTLTLPTTDGNANQFLSTDGTGILSWRSPRSQRFYSYTADQLDSPNGTDWAVNDFASLGKDTNNSALRVRRFDNITEEGIGCTHHIPDGSTQVRFRFRTRAETTPTAGQTCIINVYRREMPNDGAVEAWSTAQALTAFTYPANENWQYDNQTFTLSSLGLVAGRTVQYEFTRNGGTVSSDITLLLLIVEYS